MRDVFGGPREKEAPRVFPAAGPRLRSLRGGCDQVSGDPSTIAPTDESIQSQLGEAACRPFDKKASVTAGRSHRVGGLGESTAWVVLSVKPPPAGRFFQAGGGSAAAPRTGAGLPRYKRTQQTATGPFVAAMTCITFRNVTSRANLRISKGADSYARTAPGHADSPS